MSHLINTKAVNTSTSKALYAFSKSPRFGEKKMPTNVQCYEVHDEFKNPKGLKKEWFPSQARFDYYQSAEKSDKNRYSPSPFQYKIASEIGGTGHKKKYSFGVGRTQMQPLYIDDVMMKADKKVSPPGPGNYADYRPFGDKSGQFTSIYTRLDIDNIALKKSAKLPGPATYKAPEVLSRGVQSSLIPNAPG